jgi:hypothetical protein
MELETDRTNDAVEKPWIHQSTQSWTAKIRSCKAAINLDWDRIAVDKTGCIDI